MFVEFVRAARFWRTSYPFQAANSIIYYLQENMTYPRIVEVLIFSMLTAEVQAAMLCSTSKAGQLFKVATQVNCDEEHYKVVPVTVWKRNIREWKSKARSLQVIEKICETYTSFWGTKTKEKNK